jgi:hypothetical protein
MPSPGLSKGSQAGFPRAWRAVTVRAMMWAGFEGTSARAVGDTARGKFARSGSQAETRL